MSESDKYGRCLHAHISLGTTSDDRFMPSGYVKAFSEMPGLVMTEKLDGQNNCFKKSGVYARSHVAPTEHPWDKPMRERWELIKNDLGDLELFGENMYGIHSVAYNDLESYYYMFAAREKGRWLSWEEVKFYANYFDFPTVPEIPILVSLKDYYKGKEDADENKVLAHWLRANLGMTWEESIDTPGLLGGYDPETGAPASEGFVIRNIEGFESRNAGALDVHDNEFANLFKLVRKGHVKTDEHWTKTWRPATLTDYYKYNWYGYEYLSKKDSKVDLDFPGAEHIGKIVRYKGETGVVVVTPEDSKEMLGDICIRWDNSRESDYEGFYGLPVIFITDYDLKHINIDGSLKK